MVYVCKGCDFSRESSLDNATEIITDYIEFCVDTVIPKKKVKVYPNNKPYVTKEVKDCINRKHRAFKNKDHLQLKLYKRS